MPKDSPPTSRTVREFTAEPAVELPTDIATEIGGMVAAFALLEHRLSHLLFALVGVDEVLGRMAVRNPRPAEVWGLIMELCDFHGIRIKDSSAKELRAAELPAHVKLRTAIEDCSSRRDELIHGIWTRDPATKQIMLRVTRGTWPAGVLPRDKTKRLQLPEARPVTAPDCKKLREDIALAGC